MMIGTKKNMMDSDEDYRQKSTRDSLSSDCDFSKPVWVRHTGVQTDTINKRLLEYNVHSIWIGCCIFLVVLCFL
jgi:hypothetical protein